MAKNIVLRHGGRIWAETHDQACWSFVLLFGKQPHAIGPSDLMLEIMNSRPELKRMLALIADMIAKVVGVERCFLFLADSTTEGLLLGASNGDETPADAEIEIGRGQGLSGKVFEDAVPIVLNSGPATADSTIRDVLPFETSPCASVPVRLKGKAIGVLTVAGKGGESEVFDGKDLCLLAALGDRIGVAFERATSYESARDQFVSAMVVLRSVLEARRALRAASDEHASPQVESAAGVEGAA